MSDSSLSSSDDYERLHRGFVKTAQGFEHMKTQLRAMSDVAETRGMAISEVRRLLKDLWDRPLSQINSKLMRETLKEIEDEIEGLP